MNRPPAKLEGLADELLTAWLGITERELKREIDRISAADMKFKRVLRDAMRVQDEVDKRGLE